MIAKRKYGKYITFILIIISFLIYIMFNQTDINADSIWDKQNNTAYITEKTAKWVDYDNYLAELTLKVNGERYTDPLDVVVVLDRSGSMDMNYIQEIPDGNGGTKGYHNASSPCLNQEHFYLEETNEIPTVIPSSTEDTHYDANTQRLTVFNAEKNAWVVLATSDEKHLYYQFGNTVADPASLLLAAYHFKHDGGEYVRISKWDTTDVRKGSNDGIWVHADEDEGCYDRWIEAKNAVETFSSKLLEINQQHGLTGDNANKVALVPFSIRDETLLQRLNNNQKGYRDWLIQNSYFNGTSVNVEADGTLSGSYNSRVSWTENQSEISSTLSRLFTTHTTDYMYGLSEAYNLLDARTPAAKANKKSIVLLLSDGTPDPANGTLSGAGNIYAFYNTDSHVYGISDAIKNPTNQISTEAFWAQTTGAYQRHSVNPNILAKDSSANIIGAYGQNTNMTTVGYMLDSQDSKERLEKIASYPSDYIDIPADATGSTENYLTEKLLESIVIPGGRNAVLYDEISEYYYIPEDAVLPSGVTVEGTPENGQRIVWEIGTIFQYEKKNEPTIRIPLVLKEAYRDVDKPTYYPTNDDKPEPDLTTPTPGEDGENTGAKLHYVDPNGVERYDTIGTPKLAVTPQSPSPAIKPSVKPSTLPPSEQEELVDILMIPSKSLLLGDNDHLSLYFVLLALGLIGTGSIATVRKKHKHDN